MDGNDVRNPGSEEWVHLNPSARGEPEQHRLELGASVSNEGDGENVKQFDLYAYSTGQWQVTEWMRTEAGADVAQMANGCPMLAYVEVKGWSEKDKLEHAKACALAVAKQWGAA